MVEQFDGSAMVLRRVRAVAIAILVCAAAIAGARADGPESPEQFLRRLHAGYAIETGPNAPDYLGKQAPKVFDPGLLSLILRDEATANGEIGLLDVDPICSCQDPGGLRVLRVAVQPLGASQADAVVTFSFPYHGQTETLRYQLVAVNGQWRIHDIGHEHLAGLRQ
jgi:Protein of unknown function (DUF3828)